MSHILVANSISEASRFSYCRKIPLWRGHVCNCVSRALLASFWDKTFIDFLSRIKMLCLLSTEISFSLLIICCASEEEHLTELTYSVNLIYKL